MRLKWVSILGFYFLNILSPLFSQTNEYGFPLVTNYPYNIMGGSEQNWAITQDHRGVVYVGNNDKGILEYDGVEWRRIPVPRNAPVLSLETSSEGTIYAGLSRDFGRLEPDLTGLLHFRSLCDSTTRARVSNFDVWRTFTDDTLVYFCSPPAIFIYNQLQDTLTVLNTPTGGFFSFLVGDTLYHTNFLSGLMKVENDSFIQKRGGEFFRQKSVMGIVKLDRENLLVGTYFNGLYTYNLPTGKIKPFTGEALNEELREAGITNLSASAYGFLVCTENNGLYIFDEQGTVTGMISKSEELKDQTISQAYTNPEMKELGPIWLAHWKGVSKLDSYSPLRHFKETDVCREGLAGLIHDINRMDGILYVATSQGLFYKSGMGFVKLPDVWGQVWDLEVIETAEGRKFLIASNALDIFLVDGNQNVILLRNQLQSEPDTESDLTRFGGRRILPDPDRPGVFYAGTDELFGFRYSGNRWRELFRFSDLEYEIRDMVIDRNRALWISLRYGNILRMDLAGSGPGEIQTYSDKEGIPSDDDIILFLDQESGELLAGTDSGFFRYDAVEDRFSSDTLINPVLPEGKNAIQELYRDKDGHYWISFENELEGWSVLTAEKRGPFLNVIDSTSFKVLANASVDAFFDDDEKGMWFSNSNELYHYNKGFVRSDTMKFDALIRKIVINDGASILFNGTNFRVDRYNRYLVSKVQEEKARPVLKYRYKNIEFHWAAPYFEQENKIVYSYRLDDFDDHWSGWGNETSIRFTNLPPGPYTMQVKAKNLFGRESEQAVYRFRIKAPVYRSGYAVGFYILLVLFLVYYIYLFIHNRRLLREVNVKSAQVLHQKEEIEKRNKDLEDMNEEITAQRDKIVTQRNQLSRQKDVLESQKREITDSIQYSRRIQNAILPYSKYLDTVMPEYFILFRPRDIVSGDFFWVREVKNFLVVVAADCTGHGVPGALMSVLGISLLNEIMSRSRFDMPGEALDRLRRKVKATLAQEGTEGEQKDGMDIAMVDIDRETLELQYAGAFNPLYLVRKDQEGKGITDADRTMSLHGVTLYEFKADRQPIGVYSNEADFHTRNVQLHKGDIIYLFSDGFVDQIGGPGGKKFMSRRFKRTLLCLEHLPMPQQKEELDRILDNWQGQYDQVDDILLLGIRF